MAISRFKARCLSVLAEVQRTGRPLLVTRFGKPMAEIVPPKVKKRKSWLGALEGTATLADDLIAPTGAEWEVLKP